MLKYLLYDIAFREVPGESSLVIDITNCPNRCKCCHSAILTEDVGTELSEAELSRILSMSRHQAITCVVFAGGDRNPDDVFSLAKFVKNNYPALKTCWYSGTTKYEHDIDTFYGVFDYMKFGPYIEELGPLTSKTTNQRMYELSNNTNTNITYKFWKK